MEMEYLGKKLVTSSSYDLLWEYAAERQATYWRRLRGLAPPWTADPAMAAWRYTNVYRVSDRVSQYLLREVVYRGGAWTSKDVFLRTLLFKFFNRVDTWEHLVDRVGQPTWAGFGVRHYAAALDARVAEGKPLYNAAYVMLVGPRLGEATAHADRLRLLERMVIDGCAAQVVDSASLEGVYELLRRYPSVGRFLAYQYALDLNYTTLCDHGEDWVVTGPGARAGLKLCFETTGGLPDADVCRMLARLAPLEFAHRGLAFEELPGRPLQAVDVEHLLCEIAKYVRAREGGRNKQVFREPDHRPIPPLFLPPKWA